MPIAVVGQKAFTVLWSQTRPKLIQRASSCLLILRFNMALRNSGQVFDFFPCRAGFWGAHLPRLTALEKGLVLWRQQQTASRLEGRNSYTFFIEVPGNCHVWSPGSKFSMGSCWRSSRLASVPHKLTEFSFSCCIWGLPTSELNHSSNIFQTNNSEHWRMQIHRVC